MLGSQILRPLSLVSTDGGHSNLRFMPYRAPALVQQAPEAIKTKAKTGVKPVFLWALAVAAAL